jgi:hypothetical protein
MIYFLIFSNLLTFSCLFLLVKRHMQTLEQFEDLTERIEESLDVLDFSYGRMTKLLETPVAFDDPIAVELVQSAKNARDAMLLVANNIVNEKLQPNNE